MSYGSLCIPGEIRFSRSLLEVITSRSHWAGIMRWLTIQYYYHILPKTVTAYLYGQFCDIWQSNHFMMRCNICLLEEINLLLQGCSNYKKKLGSVIQFVTHCIKAVSFQTNFCLCNKVHLFMVSR